MSTPKDQQDFNKIGLFLNLDTNDDESDSDESDSDDDEESDDDEDSNDDDEGDCAEESDEKNDEENENNENEDSNEVANDEGNGEKNVEKNGNGKVLLFEAKQVDGQLFGFDFKKNFRDEASDRIKKKWSDVDQDKVNFAVLNDQLDVDKLHLTIEFYRENKNDAGVTEVATLPSEGNYTMLEYGLLLNVDDEISGEDFIDAAKENDIDKVKAYCKQGNDIYYTNDSGMGAFEYACNAGHIKIAKYLIKNGLDIGRLEDLGFYLLINAVKSGYVRIANLLIVNGCYLDQQLSGLNPFIEACYTNNEKMIKLLISNRCDTSYVTEDGTLAIDCITDAVLKQKIQEFMREQQQIWDCETDDNDDAARETFVEAYNNYGDNRSNSGNNDTSKAKVPANRQVFSTTVNPLLSSPSFKSK